MQKSKSINDNLEFSPFPGYQSTSIRSILTDYAIFSVLALRKTMRTVSYNPIILYPSAKRLQVCISRNHERNSNECGNKSKKADLKLETTLLGNSSVVC